MDAATKTNRTTGFEDFTLGQRIDHATPAPSPPVTGRCTAPCIRRVRLLPSSGQFTDRLRTQPGAPVEELIGFHIAFGKTVPDISRSTGGQPGLRRVPLPSTGAIPGDALSALR